MKYKNYICHASYLRNSVAYDYDFWYICKIMMSIGFFSFFQNVGFSGCLEGKRAKIGPK